MRLFCFAAGFLALTKKEVWKYDATTLQLIAFPVRAIYCA